MASWLDKSRRALGFDDPLTIRFDLHRWLSAEREEAYSDWLAWIVNELRLPDLVGQLLFGSQVPRRILESGGACFADRERGVPEGRPGQQGRTDCVIRLDTSAVILIEVKLTNLKDADLGGLSGYRKWLDGEGGDFRRFLLLVRDHGDGRIPDEIKFIDKIIEWKDLCINLRRMLPQLVLERGIIVAALFAAFVGAVEMNLLGFPRLPSVRSATAASEDDELVRRVSTLGTGIDRVIQHLKMALGYEDTGD